MNFSKLSDKEKLKFSELMFAPLSSPEELKDWIKLFFGLEYPSTSCDKESNSNPLHAIWTVYNAFKINDGATPGAIWLSSRESLKTLSVAILEIILLLHFKLDIAHGAATESQSQVCLRYIESFIFKIEPLMKIAGWENLTANKRTFEFGSPDGKRPFIKVVICSTKGMNSLHSNFLVIDEIELADAAALNEGKNIVGYSRGIHGFTLYLSTRKYSFGLMSKIIDEKDIMGYSLFRWNILDVTEKCSAQRHLPDLPKEDRYVAQSLPLKQLSTEEYNLLPEIEKRKWDLVEKAHAGCKECLLLPICRTNLSKLSDSAKNGFYKPIKAVMQKFRENPPDIAEAQLLCFGPGAQVLMGDGSCKNIEDIQIGDEVISHTGSKQKVTELFKRKYSGETIEIEHFNWRKFDKLIVTPEHPYFINGEKFAKSNEVKKFKFDKHGSLKTKGDYISLPINYDSIEKTIIKYDDFVKDELKFNNNKVKINSSTGRYVPYEYPLNEEFGWIIGYFLAEGFFARRSYSKQIKRLTSITFCSDCREAEYHERVRNFAKWAGLTVSEFKAKVGHGYTIDIYNNSLSSLFLELCDEYSDKKRLHPFLMDANENFLRGVLLGFDAGDGTKRKNCYRELTTTSYQLATQLFLIAMRFGLCPRLKKNRLYKNGKQSYRVIYIDKDYTQKQKRTRFITNNNYNLYRIDKIETNSYTGDVYNIEVENDNSYIVNGAAVHNCWKPGSEGLVYPRFVNDLNNGNVLSLKEAYYALTGDEIKFVNELTLLNKMQELDIEFYAGVDWGFTHDAVIVIVAEIPNGEIWVVDCFASPGLEFSDILQTAISFRDKYNPSKWFCDTAMPSHIKSFNKNGMKAPNFVKDVIGGIEAVRSKIVNSIGKRFLKILNTDNNKKVITAFGKHRFILDGQGNPTAKPDDESGTADILDSMRYIFQNKWPVKGPQKPGYALTDHEIVSQTQNPTATEQMRNEILSRISDGNNLTGGVNKKGGLKWSF